VTNMDNEFRAHEATPVRLMREGERLVRAREAWIAANRPWRWLARRIRAGKHDAKLRPILMALEDTPRPIELIVADRDEATVAFLLKQTPNLPRTPEVAAALFTAVRMGRRG
jgi:hypothetical protein